MYKVSSWLIAGVAALSLTWATASVALAEEYQCTGTVGTESLDNIVVPDGQTCVLNGTHAEGNVVVGTGSTLQASGVSVDGNIQAEGSTNVTVNNGSTVGGSIQLKQGGSATVAGVNVEGDIQFEQNSGAISADNNVVGGNLQAYTNRGGIDIRNNRIDGNLQCIENNPAPTGGNNQAASLEDQCAGLSGTPQQPTPQPTTQPTPVPTVQPTPTTQPPGGDETCQRTIGNQTFENLFVPDGKNCVLNGTRVDGNIIVGTGATLQASGVVVGGNIQAEGAANVTVNNNSSVGGNIQIKQGETVAVIGTQVEGDIQFDDNSSQITADNNVVGGNLQAFTNRGGLIILNNRIDGNLQCNENNPAPVGSNNQAASLEDQCADLDVPANPEQPLPPGGDETCQAILGNQTFENLTVPDGQTCVLNSTRVNGNIVVGTGSTLQASGISVGGNIQAEGAKNVIVVGDDDQAVGATNAAVSALSSVGGSIQIKQGESATVANVQVTGDIQFEQNSSQITADNNVVGGNLQAFTNSGRLTILNNRIDGNLQCNENTLAPLGSNNQATSLENQCESLSAQTPGFPVGIYMPTVLAR